MRIFLCISMRPGHFGRRTLCRSLLRFKINFWQPREGAGIRLGAKPIQMSMDVEFGGSGASRALVAYGVAAANAAQSQQDSRAAGVRDR